MKNALRWAERGLLPDALIRTGIRKLLGHRIAEIDPGDCQDRTQHLEAVYRSNGRKPHCAAYARGQRTALRAATGL